MRSRDARWTCAVRFVPTRGSHVASGLRVTALRVSFALCRAGIKACASRQARASSSAVGRGRYSCAALKLQHKYPGDFSKIHCNGESSAAREVEADASAVVPEVDVDDGIRVVCIETVHVVARGVTEKFRDLARRHGEHDGVEGWLFVTLRQAQGDGACVVQFDARNRGGEMHGVEFGGSGLREMRERNERETEARCFGVVEKCGRKTKIASEASTRSNGALSAGMKNGSQNARRSSGP